MYGKQADEKSIPTKDFFVVFDYKTRKVYTINSLSANYNWFDCLPANFRETEIFIKNFVSKGIKECKFREYKVFDNFFHGTAKFKKTYETLELDAYQYKQCLRIIEEVKDCNTISSAFNYILQMSKMDDKKKEEAHIEDFKKYLTKAFKSLLKDLAKQIDK